MEWKSEGWWMMRMVSRWNRWKKCYRKNRMGESDLERLVSGWRREAGSWFQRRWEAYWKEWSVIRREDNVDGRASVTKDEVQRIQDPSAEWNHRKEWSVGGGSGVGLNVIKTSPNVLCLCCLRRCLGLPLTTVQHVMYFRFCRWRHFSRNWDQSVTESVATHTNYGETDSRG